MRSAAGRRAFVIWAGLASNIAVAVVKFIAAGVTGSSAMVAEGVHSLVDSANEVLLLVGERTSAAPPDAQHPFGHGKDVYFWALVVAMVVFAGGGCVSVYEGILHAFSRERLGDPTWSYVVLALSAIPQTGSWWVACRELRAQRGGGVWTAIRETKAASVLAVFIEESADLVGLAIAAVGVFLAHRLEARVLDAAASILIGLMLGGVAVLLGAETRSLLLGESARPETVHRIHTIVEEDPLVESASAPLTMFLGPEEMLVNACVRFAPEARAGDIADATTRIEAAIRREFPLVRRVFLEVGAVRRLSSRPPR